MVESQAKTINEANEEIKRQKNSSRICGAAANSTVLQTEYALGFMEEEMKKNDVK